MLNKRIFIRNLLGNSDEGPYLDRKESIDIKTAFGKSVLLKHICALSNSNPFNEAYLVIGVTNENIPIGGPYIDDAIIQDLVGAYLQNAPIVKLENVSFPSIDPDKSIGLITIYPNHLTTSFKKNLDRIRTSDRFHRIGSKSVRVDDSEEVIRYEHNRPVVEEILRFSRNTVKDILDGTMEFFNTWDKSYNPQYVVFKELFVVCWAGWKERKLYSEVDVQIINEGVRLFYSAITEVDIIISDDKFEILEHVFIGYDTHFDFLPFELTSIDFNDNGTYLIRKKYVFEPPLYSKDEVESLFIRSKSEIDALNKMTPEQRKFGYWEITEGIAIHLLICYLNGIHEARTYFYLCNEYVDGASAQCYDLGERILIEYEKNGAALNKK